YSAGRAATTGRTGAVFNLQPPGCRGSNSQSCKMNQTCRECYVQASTHTLLFYAAFLIKFKNTA
ncbi:hypothetical protein, partial [Klebsiella pneumoniae]|uniref:hypothetical protein n=1 Tax=Klebsiella pneumoniae TaxID=573 RepID=UPI001C3E3AC0